MDSAQDSTPDIFPLLDLPELVHSNILDYLTVKEVLSFRLVNKSTCDWVKRYCHPRLQKRLKYKTIVLYSDADVASFVSTVYQLPFTQFYFRVDPLLLAESQPIQEFMRRFAPSTTCLGVREMNLCISDGEYAFYNSFTSLESLRFDSVQLFMRKDYTWPPPSIHELLARMSSSRRQLTSIAEWEMETSKARIPEKLTKTLKKFTYFRISDTTYPFDLVRSCPNLEHFSIGKTFTPSFEYLTVIIRRIQLYGAKKLTEYFEERTKREGVGKLDFELDLQQHLELFRKLEDARVRNELLKSIGGAGGIKLLNVPQHLMKCLVSEMSSDLSRQDVENVLASIHSVVGVSPASKAYELPNLEELELTTGEPGDGNVFVKDWTLSPTIFPEWPKLKKITCRLDAFGIWEEWIEPDGPPIDDLDQISAMVDFILRGPLKRNSVTKLSFGLGLNLQPPIAPEHFVTNFPNIVKLRLHIDSFSKKDYSELFLLLGSDTKIKCLKIITSVLFDDETFIGSADSEGKTEDTKHVPHFSTLKHLERVEIFKYPSNDRLAVGITDRLCTDVLAEMSLQSFQIIGHELSNVTSLGIEKLLEGNFGKSIKKFVIEHADAPPSELHEMYEDSLDELMERCELNKRYDDPKYKRIRRTLF